ncbi:hypothetical protein Tco_0600119 [Tanacetum coccineum]|uniref:Uncharacterized protein n=1 Tax=Tanacetum coccineum TaxID=301880 RepID=A0ABQ4WAU8_9ASTR
MPQQPMRSEEELCPSDKRVAVNSGTPTQGRGQGKGYMRKGNMEINVPKPKKKKYEVPRRQRTITFADNLLEDPDEALEHATLVLEKDVNKQVDEAYDAQLKLKLKDQKQTKSENSYHGDQSDKSDHDDESVDSDNGDDVNDSDKDSDAEEDQTTSFEIRAHDKEPEQPQPEPQPHSPSVTITSHEDVNRYLNDLPEVEMVELLNEPMYTESTTLTVVPILDTIHETQEDDHVDNVKESSPATTTITPPTKTNKKRAKTLLKKAIQRKNDSKKAIMQRLKNLEQWKNAHSLIDHAEAIKESIQANVINEVKNQLPKFVPKVVSNYVKTRLGRTVLDVIKKNPVNLFQSSSTPLDTLIQYELKHKLYDMMYQSRSFLAHEKHLDLYNDLMNSMKIDELVAKGEHNLTPSLRKRSHDDQNPPEDREGETRKRKAKFELILLTLKDLKMLINQDRNKSRNIKLSQIYLDKELEEHELQLGSTIMFGKCMKKFLNKDKITKADLEGPAFELLKKRFKNFIELEYNLEQCHLALIDRIDWTNPEGDRFHNDLSKPLPLTGPPGRKSIPTRYFFKNDLECLRHRNEEKKYALSVTKIKAARYEQEGIEEFIPRLWSPSIYKYNKNAELESDFTKLNQNDIEDMYLLKIKGKIHHIDDVDEVDLINALELYIKSIVIKKRVEDAYDGTLNKIREKLEVMLRDNRLRLGNEAFGKLLEEIHVTLTQFGKKRDKIAALHKGTFKECVQYLEMASGFVTTPSELTSDDVKIFVTASERNCLNETLEDSVKRRRQDSCDAGKKNEEMLIDSIENGPFKLKAEITIPGVDGATDIWDRVKELMKGTELTLQECESKLYHELDRSTSKPGESIHLYYWRYAKLINDMNIIKMTMTPIQVNTKFVNHLQQEWSRFVTAAKQAKDLLKYNFDQLYAFLKQNKSDAKEVRAMRQRYPDLLSLLVNQIHPPPSYNNSRSHYNPPVEYH